MVKFEAKGKGSADENRSLGRHLFCHSNFDLRHSINGFEISFFEFASSMLAVRMRFAV
jgi:hypothetical protein